VDEVPDWRPDDDVTPGRALELETLVRDVEGVIAGLDVEVDFSEGA